MRTSPVVAVLSVFLVLGLSGCLGGEGDAKAAPPVVTAKVEGAQDIPAIKLEDLPYEPGGTVTREGRVDEPTFPHPLVAPLISDSVVRYRISWNITGLLPVGEGEENNTVDEVFYAVWLGTRTGDTLTYAATGDSQRVAPEGKIDGETTWSNANGDVSAIKVTIETASNSQPEITLLETTTLPVNENGTWDLVDIKAWGPAFGDGKATVDESGNSVTIVVTAFGLPTGTSGVYDLFLEVPGNVSYLGTLKEDTSTSGLTVTVTVPASKLTTWSLSVSLEANKDEKTQETSRYRVLTSQFEL